MKEATWIHKLPRTTLWLQDLMPPRSQLIPLTTRPNKWWECWLPGDYCAQLIS